MLVYKQRWVKGVINLEKNINNMIYIDEIREKLGFLPKKCQYKKVGDEVIIFKLEKDELYSA